MKQIIKTIAVLLGMVSISSSIYAYDVKFGNYYFIRISATSVDDVGYVTTYHYNVEATSKEGGYSTFAQTYSGAIAPPATFTEMDESFTIAYAYTLTRIGDMAFANNASATEITIPETVTEISNMGLLANLSLRKVTCLATTPPSHNSNFLLVVTDVANSATLFVPAGCKSKYQSATGWNAFKNIVEITPSIGDHDYVDLGLPSGKLWASQNYGASSTTGYGTYVSWSTTDVVKSSWGSYWATPTRTELKELLNYCTWTWDSSMKGYTITGTNGNSMFLPAAGFQIMDCDQSLGSGIYYWSSTASSDSGFTFMLSGSSSSVNTNITYNTSIVSAPIRPIVKGMTSAIDNIPIDNADVKCIGIYDLNGRKISQIEKGFNILKMSDGTIKKILVK